MELLKTDEGRMVFVLNDIEFMRDQEEKFSQLNNINHRLLQAVDAATNGVVMLVRENGSFIVQFANSSFCQSLGRDRDQVLGCDFFYLMLTVKSEGFLKKFHENLLKGERVDTEMKFMQGKDLRCYDFNLTAVPEEDGSLNLYVGVMTDTTDLKSREARLFGAQKLEALGRISAGVAHDFNNLLSIIDGYTRLVVKNVEGKDEDSLKHLERIQAASHRGANLTRQMLTFGRHKIVTNEVIDLVEAVRRDEELIKPLLRASVSYEFQCQEEFLNIETSDDTITQILMNLVVNASDAMNAPGAIKVMLSRVSGDQLSETVIHRIGEKKVQSKIGFALLTVSDTGTGIEEDVLDKIFDPFFTTKAQGKGTGLGLSMVYGLVEQMGGAIEVLSEVGEGSVFSVYIPLSEKEPSRQVLGCRDDPLSLRLNGYTILVVEDEPDLLVLIQEMLERAGMVVLVAQDGDEALMVQDEFEGKIDMLLTDIVMPTLGGVDLAEMFESLRPDTQIVFMSGYPAEGDLSELNIPQGAFFMAKPLRYEGLVSMIYTCLAEPQSNQDFVKNSSGVWVFEGLTTTQMKEEEFV